VRCISGRIVEAYIGEYASGKSEVAVNRAIFLASSGRQVNLVDLDIVEPCYTLRPIKKKLTAMGMNVVAWETREMMGLGETGSILHPANRWALRLPGDVILDIGYGVEGAKTLNLVEGAATDPDLKIFAVVNVGRPMTGTVEEIVEYVRSLGRVDGLINNSHLGDETTVEFVQEGARIVDEAARQLGIPVVATTVLEELARVIGTHDAAGHPVWPIKRYMPQTLW
jgi:predicted TIM-barrel fold metal-dependent hydrolase